MKEFEETLHLHFDELRRALSADNGEWVIKGFIDVYRNIYTISGDTKVVSKILELLLFPVISKFAVEHDYKMFLSEEQNHYPDISLQASDGTLIALDLKSTYRNGPNSVNGMTLGAFTGYFRLRETRKNITFPYGRYAAHYVLGVIYSRQDGKNDERKVYQLEDLDSMVSVIKDFDFILQEKWKIALDRPGSGNTKNIGSITDIQKLIRGDGPFAAYGVEVFDDYWMSYLTNDMARAIESKPPYCNLDEYIEYRKSRPI